MKPLLKSKKILILIIVALVVVGGFITTVSITSRKNKERSARLTLGEKYLTELDYDKAIATFKGIIEVEPKNKEAYFGLARAYEGTNNYDYAEASYKKIIDIDKLETEAYSELAELYIRLEKLDEAEGLLKEAAELTNDKELEELYMLTQPSKPTFSVTPGVYNERQAIELVVNRDDERIYYTLDGSQPDEYSMVYSQPIILLNGITQINAYTKNSRGYSSEVVTAEYNMDIELTEVIFLDDYIRNMVCEELGVGYYSTIYNEDVERITSLTLVGNNLINSYYKDAVYFSQDTYSINDYQYGDAGNLTTLADLEKFIFLKELNIAYQEDLDLTGLYKSKRLEELSLINNGITDIGPIGSLTSLKKLCIAWNEIRDISALSGLDNLTSLGIWGNKISDISVIADMTKLEYLDFSDNDVEDISPIKNLSQLNSLWMYDNRVYDISPLKKLNNLETLMLRDNPIDDIQILKDIFPRLNRLDVSPFETGGVFN